MEKGEAERLKGKVAVITGGASGIGKATALLFTKEGASVVIADVDMAAGKALSRQINDTFSAKRAFFVYCDVREASHLTEAIQAAVREFDGFDIMCNNAGISLPGQIFPGGISREAWRRLIDINFTAVVEGTQQAWLEMKKDRPGAVHQNKGGVIINTASMSGLVPMPHDPVYAATKAGVVNFTRSLAELAIADNIAIHAICPSFTLTPLVERHGEQMMEAMSALVGGMLPVEEVAVGMLELALLPRQRSGAIMRVTVRGGRDYWPKTAPRPQPNLADNHSNSKARL
ncbi:Momilactone A synthase-like [Balamuthia mandrillaris]